MKLFRCQQCGQMLFFENTRCERCGHALGFEWQSNDLLTLEPVDAQSPEGPDKRWHSVSVPANQYTYCANAAYNACNWLVLATSGEKFCLSCGLNRTIPDLTDPTHVEEWRNIEAAKRRLIYTLLRFGLPVVSKERDPQNGLTFDFLADHQDENGNFVKVTTGHDDGIVTLNINEADDAERERMRHEMGEAYRTLVGHFRHEIGHYYWMLFAKDEEWLTGFRQLFGDEREDYGQALERHYANGAPGDWQEHFVSTYASSHPWEDWAESWAHYCHIVDTLETAFAFGIALQPRVTHDETLAAEVDVDPYRAVNFDTLFDMWLPLTFAINGLNRSMGVSDLYPFVNSTPAQEKMKFIHQTIHKGL